jgi:hypothetical protein
MEKVGGESLFSLFQKKEKEKNICVAELLWPGYGVPVINFWY